MSRLVSPRQREALEALAAGAKIFVVRHAKSDLSDAAFISNHNRPGHETISTATVQALAVQGWLTDEEDPGYSWRGSRYVISAKGRAALRKEHEDERQAKRGKQ